ncbi:MAG TPA: bifunctional YncE family protein/alkaline phosphatase family protein [Candidatus Hydrogenedentes bacterium]|jgi:YVTN family beta-propeller protein|nr:bifunctional YncE family protein/alkaline phosphatase family protein [FCB group bacterium]HNZ17881.1 bifunctional YncE family protein/alkaline phosphatase family protein [Candidatus Hydrogenedentota bacterium]HOH32785.1 bifunctional YncE family protein/alkaline phosphatase family protein [Candidatus Hydrogenedentota bacterium]HQH69358.1 bifunctional YncE family protein/alkaline phosphatase family protein [Candidatus Hydrogenedentota bacterium]HQM32644.1 bifunctional YncE family protein/alkal
MKSLLASLTVVLALTSLATAGELPGPSGKGYILPNRWRITPVGKAIDTNDLLLNIELAPDGKAAVAVHGGYNAHGLVVIDTATGEAAQTINLPTAWVGLAWSPNGANLYVSGGNNKSRDGIRAPIYVFGYQDGRLTEKPVATFTEDIEPGRIFWSGLVHHPAQNLLYAANRTNSYIVVFDTATGSVINRIPTELNPYELALTPDGATLYVSNWGSDSVSVIDTETGAVLRTIAVGDNPNDLALARDGRLFVCCANDNAVTVIDPERGRPTETIVTSLYPQAPEGSTPNALALDHTQNILYIANADNNNVCVVSVEEPGESTVLGFLPVGWYPSSVAVSADGETLYVGNGKGVGHSSANPRGPHSPLPAGEGAQGTTKTLMRGAISIIDVPRHRRNLRKLTRQAYANCPYNDELLATARPDTKQTVIPREVGKASKHIKHVIYIIKENRTYDQVLGDLPQGNGDPRITLFGREVTPNQHAIVETFVLLDNLYCDAEVSVDGHQWSNAAYATDFTEKSWPASYGGKSDSPRSPAVIPGAGYLWDQCARKGLTYRSYGEFARRVSDGGIMEPADARLTSLHGHIAPNYLNWGARDYENAAEFIREFDEYEKNYDHPDPAKRLPNYIVMGLPEDHTKGTRPGDPTPRAAVASNDYALGLIVERVSHSKYWPEIAFFVIEDDAQDGADHVDARRTTGYVISPYIKRGTVDSTFYTTCSLLRTMELILGLQPMSQYDAAANAMFACFTDTPDLTPFNHIEPNIDLQEVNTKTAWGAEDSMKMDFSDYDRTPMFELNEIVWKSVKGPDSEMPVPVHRFNTASIRE